MFDLVYSAFFFAMIFEVVLFLVFNMPFPRSWRSALFIGVVENPKVRLVFKVQMVLCLIILLFFVDLHRTERRYTREKNGLKRRTTMGAGELGLT
jgi:pilus assembly protein TadC